MLEDLFGWMCFNPLPVLVSVTFLRMSRQQRDVPCIARRDNVARDLPTAFHPSPIRCRASFLTSLSHHHFIGVHTNSTLGLHPHKSNYNPNSINPYFHYLLTVKNLPHRKDKTSIKFHRKKFHRYFKLNIFTILAFCWWKFG